MEKTRYFFELEKKQGENKMWNRIKNTEGKNKYDIDSIIDEQIKFYFKLFTNEGWDENSANKLTQNMESKLNGDEKETRIGCKYRRNQKCFKRFETK